MVALAKEKNVRFMEVKIENEISILRGQRERNILSSIKKEQDLTTSSIDVSVKKTHPNYNVLKWQIVKYNYELEIITDKIYVYLQTRWMPKAGVVHIQNDSYPFDIQDNIIYIGIGRNVQKWRYKKREIIKILDCDISKSKPLFNLTGIVPEYENKEYIYDPLSLNVYYLFS